MKGIVAVPVAAALTWALAPFADMAVRGTIDSRTRAAWRTEVAAPTADAPAVPAPRSSSESAPSKPVPA